jgi:hypothetical protein
MPSRSCPSILLHLGLSQATPQLRASGPVRSTLLSFPGGVGKKSTFFCVTFEDS